MSSSSKEARAKTDGGGGGKEARVVAAIDIFIIICFLFSLYTLLLEQTRL